MIPTLVGLGIGVGAKSGMDYLKGSLSNYFAEKRSRDQAALEYMYAQRYAENSPSWTVKGLRNAGLNPILAASGGFSAPNWKPSSPSTPDTNSGLGIDAFDSMLTNRQTRKNSQSQIELNESQAGLNSANVDFTKAQTAVKLLEAERIKNELKGKDYKNPIVNDVIHGMNDVAEALKSKPFNSPTIKDTRAEYIKVAPESSFYSKDTFFGKIQSGIDADREVKRITGKSWSEVNKMSDSEKTKILMDENKKRFKTKGYHIFTR